MKTKPYNLLNIFVRTPLLLGVLVFLWGCENDIEKVKELTAKQDSAIVSARNIEMIYTTKGIYNVLMKAPLLNRYIEEKQKTYLEFPEGVSLFFYDEKGKVTSTLKANYSIYYEDEGRWIARYDVVAVNDKGETLNTEYLIWLQKEKTISSDQFVKVSTADGVLYGDGFVSDQTFSSYEIINNRGEINFTENE
ncbi:MAG: LPS export ABC transporter periplasmic protein LptC [Salinivirgaceae bacterium]